MEQRGEIRFFMLKGLEVKDIQSELESGYGPKALVLPTVRKWQRPS
jgi:hypothetical protein